MVYGVYYLAGDHHKEENGWGIYEEKASINGKAQGIMLIHGLGREKINTSDDGSTNVDITVCGR